jgi:putative oxygen-independent coproporphyrinogen III oxidase
MLQVLPPLSLYIHLPWCVRKCPYCDFNSYTAGVEAPRARYLDALLVDLKSEANRAAGRPLISVFLGGGTPSLFPPDEIARLLTAVQDEFELADGIEITMEANPGTVECGDPAGYRAAGVNRLSIGAQSFDSGSLRTLGRIHVVDDIIRAADEARAAGIENFNIDLMYGLPGQNVNAALYDIEQAAALGPTHISWYQLTLEPNTVFYARPPAGLPDNDFSAEIQVQGQQLLAGLGFGQYEVSAYARDGRRCRHNENYWSFGDYLAVGAGAHGKVSGPAGISRYSKAANPLQYMNAIERRHEDPTAGTDSKLLNSDELAFEFMLNASRLIAGFGEQDFVARTGLPRDDLRNRLLDPARQGLISEQQAGIWQPTDLGRRFLNDLQAAFLPD